MRQRRGSPVQERRRIRLTRTGAIQTTAKVHVSSGTRLSFVFTETSVGSKRIRMKRIRIMYRFWASYGVISNTEPKVVVPSPEVVP